MFEKVAIIGPGLIGGSMGLGLRSRGLAQTVVGIGRRRESLDKALEIGAIDTASLDPKTGVQDADLVVLATPISTFADLTAQVADSLRAGALFTDVASTKVEVVEVISSALHSRPDVSYIPTHPMAGSEQRGPEAAKADLFAGAICIVTPLTDTFPESKSCIAGMWRALGAKVVSMTPQAHDRAVARISHMPHLAAAALMAVMDEADARLCGKGLLDTTRVASGSPSIWTDICRANREHIRASVTEYIGLLQKMVDALDNGNMARLNEILETAKSKRDRLARDRQVVEPPREQ